jgi:hypothetical protein
LAPSARSATSISPIASASRNGPPTTAGAPSSSTTGTISTASERRLGSVLATVTVGAVYPGRVLTCHTLIAD